MRKAFATTLLALAASAHADSSECEIHKLATFPFPHRPTADQAAALKDCSADKLYYGIGVHFDYVKARHCAFAADSQDVLMMLYANGLGVPRNYAVAKMAACRSEPTEIEERLARLARMQTGKEGPSPKIDMCDDAANSHLQSRCAAIRLDLIDQERNARIDTISTRWSDGEKSALQQVRRQAAEPAQIEEILSSLLDFEAGKLPSFTTEDAAAAEREMSQMKISPDKQRGWLAYRDAWLALGKLRYPSVAPHAWKAYFAKRRIAAIKAQ
ncbi:hypothetical protein SAMN05518865_107106 [Duganella sp. CF458]|uniref:hypothetical protein n=1 Tax=Duganella sp. CF458 TaxID=1884368 RepID=UPI0008E9144E|nr:hypothetical protein [Duganella sp. CF458]SFG01410.1 hypothetical protein SAMN05518865_107106 [Duganella sp. CF458]